MENFAKLFERFLIFVLCLRDAATGHRLEVVDQSYGIGWLPGAVPRSDSMIPIPLMMDSVLSGSNIRFRRLRDLCRTLLPHAEGQVVRKRATGGKRHLDRARGHADRYGGRDHGARRVDGERRHSAVKYDVGRAGQVRPRTVTGAPTAPDVGSGSTKGSRPTDSPKIVPSPCVPPA